jgi:hypothetical protein
MRRSSSSTRKMFLPAFCDRGPRPPVGSVLSWLNEGRRFVLRRPALVSTSTEHERRSTLMSSEPSRVARVVPTELDRRVLAALPRYTGPSEWPTVAEISERAGVPADVARSCLVGLRGHHLVEGDGRMETFARTKRGDVALERGEVSDSPDSYTRYGPSDKAGQPCVACGRPAPPAHSRTGRRGRTRLAPRGGRQRFRLELSLSRLPEEARDDRPLASFGAPARRSGGVDGSGRRRPVRHTTRR